MSEPTEPYVIPDLLGITVEELDALPDTVLTEAIRQYRKRICQPPADHFNASILGA